MKKYRVFFFKIFYQSLFRIFEANSPISICTTIKIIHHSLLNISFREKFFRFCAENLSFFRNNSLAKEEGKPCSM